MDWGSELYFRGGSGVSNSTRGIIGVGQHKCGGMSQMLYTTIESSGHLSFGDLTQTDPLLLEVLHASNSWNICRR